MPRSFSIDFIGKVLKNAQPAEVKEEDLRDSISKG